LESKDAQIIINKVKKIFNNQSGIYEDYTE
jgi:hypothetical protein